MSISWSNEETFKFIDLYQSEPALWDLNTALHKDKNKVNDAWNRIADSLQIPVSELKKNKETLMSAFRMHFKKNKIRSDLAILNKDQQNKIEDDCDLYGRLLANKLRKYSDNERQEIMYDIDGLLLNGVAIVVLTTSYSCPSPSSPWINRPSSLTSSNHSYIIITSPIQSPSPIPPAQTPSPLPPTELPNASYTQEVVYQSPNRIHTPVPTIHIPEGSMQIISDELYSQTQSQSENILADAYARALNNDCKITN
ncbi:unnamed protein product [Pieris macdunnoughi]|uniref:MADF domain-containing protein n=1 Tax=Pieris macdunnoughi TaxID=345717 RepID=A0A821Q0E7_9NEOP|nr:unnamed protein product [Pieris macdunnoughi]